MIKEDFFQLACLQAIRILNPSYWDDKRLNDKGTDQVIDFATKLTNKVYEYRENN